MKTNMVVNLKDGTLHTFVELWYVHSEMLRAMLEFNSHITTAKTNNTVLNLHDHSLAAATVFDKV